ncbi:nucleotide exchange factor GrpE [Buchnera aphidicola]|uniref:nucleotide exchange factor GrpE n=1 Tax=Buchnera aphidicola TaxID=9 RepID=UPI003BEEF981
MTSIEENNIDQELFSNINNEINDIKNKEKKDDNTNKDTNYLIKKNLLYFLEDQFKAYHSKILEDQINFEQEKIKLKNRLKQDIEKNKKYCLEKILIFLISVNDNIERALNLLENKKKEKNYILIIQNLINILKKLKIIFKEHYVKKINDVNVLFDPLIHEAMSIHYNDDIPSNQVIEIIQTGYILHNCRLLRPAMAIVSQKKN